jgi:hypothetical protein
MPHGGFHSTSPPPTDDQTGDTKTSSDSSAPAVDPIQARREAMLQQIYMQLWGEPAPESYIKSSSNLNSYEFALQEKSKPAWIQSKAFKDAYDGVAGMMSRLGI